MKKFISALCVLAILFTAAASAATYEVREDMAMSYGPGIYFPESNALKSYCQKTGLSNFEYGYLVMYYGGFGGGGADASLPVNDTKGCTKLVFDARIIGNDFCSAAELYQAAYPDEEPSDAVYAPVTTCDVSVQQHWDEEPDENFPQKWIELTNEWKHYEVDITGIDKCRVYINPIGAVSGKNECSAALVANLKLVSEDGSTTEVSSTEPSEWARAEVEKANDYGITAGLYSMGIELKDFYRGNITREEFATLIVSTVEQLEIGVFAPLEEDVEYIEIGDDVPLTDIFGVEFTDTDNENIYIAYEMGIVKGVGNNMFAPDKNITRQEIAVMMHRAIQYIENETGKKYINDNTALNGYSDVNLLADWATASVGALANNGIMKGTSDTKLSPLNNTSREQAIILAKRIYELVK